MSIAADLTNLTEKERRLLEVRMKKEVRRAERKTRRELLAAKRQVALAENRAKEAERRLADQERRHARKSDAEERARQQAEVPTATRPTVSQLAEALLPTSPVPSTTQVLLAQRSAEARWSLLQEFGAYTSENLADLRSQAKNRHALANRWRSEGKVFSVEYQGQRLYPGFQFDPETYAPKSGVAPVLAALPRERMSEWEVALWWAAGNGWLDGERPVDLLAHEPERLVEAAAHLSEPSPL